MNEAPRFCPVYNEGDEVHELVQDGTIRQARHLTSLRRSALWIRRLAGSPSSPCQVERPLPAGFPGWPRSPFFRRNVSPTPSRHANAAANGVLCGVRTRAPGRIVVLAETPLSALHGDRARACGDRATPLSDRKTCLTPSRGAAMPITPAWWPNGAGSEPGRSSGRPPCAVCLQCCCPAD